MCVGVGGGGGGVACSLVNFIVAYEETEQNLVSDFISFVCSLFPNRLDFNCILC